MSTIDEKLQQLEDHLLAVPDGDHIYRNCAHWYVSVNFYLFHCSTVLIAHSKTRSPEPEPAVTPSPFEDYQQSPFHWTGESHKRNAPGSPYSAQSPASIHSPETSLSPLGLVPPPEPSTQTALRPKTLNIHKRRFKKPKRVLSLNNNPNKPTPPDTAPPTPTIPNLSTSSEGVRNIESLTRWQLPDHPAVSPVSDGEFFDWSGTSLRTKPVIEGLYEPPFDQLSPPSSVPSESDILPRESLVNQICKSSPSTTDSVLLPDHSYSPAIYDEIDLSNPAVLERSEKGMVIAGTIEGLVAYITSPECLDYEILGDFFMIYRGFLEPNNLLALLCARFEWGLIKGSPVVPPDNEGIQKQHQN